MVTGNQESFIHNGYSQSEASKIDIFQSFYFMRNFFEIY